MTAEWWDDCPTCGGRVTGFSRRVASMGVPNVPPIGDGVQADPCGHLVEIVMTTMTVHRVELRLPGVTPISPVYNVPTDRPVNERLISEYGALRRD